MIQFLDSFKDIPWPMLVSMGINFGLSGILSLIFVALGVYAWRFDGLSGGLMVSSGAMKCILPIVSMFANSLVSVMSLGTSSGSFGTDSWYFWSSAVNGGFSLVYFAVELAFLVAVARLIGLRIAGRFVSDAEA